MSKERRRICFFMCYIHNEVANMSCRRCPFYRVESNDTMCLTDRHIWCSSNDYDVDGVIKEATYYKNSMVIIT